MSDSLNNIIPSSGGSLTYKYGMLDCRGDKNIQWAVDGDTDWFTLTDNQASKTLVISANAVDDEKSVVVTPVVNGDRCPQDITIKQRGCGLYMESIKEYPHLGMRPMKHNNVLIFNLKEEYWDNYYSCTYYGRCKVKPVSFNVTGDIARVIYNYPEDERSSRFYYMSKGNSFTGFALQLVLSSSFSSGTTYTGTVEVIYEVEDDDTGLYTPCSYSLNIDYRPPSCDEFTINGVHYGGVVSGLTVTNGKTLTLPFTSVNQIVPIDYDAYNYDIDIDYTANEIHIKPKLADADSEHTLTFGLVNGYEETDYGVYFNYTCEIPIVFTVNRIGCGDIEFVNAVDDELVFEGNANSFSAYTNDLYGVVLSNWGSCSPSVTAETNNAYERYGVYVSDDGNSVFLKGRVDDRYDCERKNYYDDQTDIVHITIPMCYESGSDVDEVCNLTIRVTRRGKPCECGDITVDTYKGQEITAYMTPLSSMTFSFFSNQLSSFTYMYDSCAEVEPYIEKSAYIDINGDIVEECDDFVNVITDGCAIQDHYGTTGFCKRACSGHVMTISNNVQDVDGQLYTRRSWIGYKVKNKYGEPCENLSGFTIDQKPIVCGCDSASYFVHNGRWTFDEEGYNQRFLVMSASTQGCGILSALTISEMLVNGSTSIEYSTDELGNPSGNCYVWCDGVLPNSDMARTTFVYFFLKAKGSSEFKSCGDKGIWIVQDSDIKMCPDYDISYIVYPTTTIGATSTNIYPLRTSQPNKSYYVGGENRRYVYYYAESNVDWISVSFNNGTFNFGCSVNLSETPRSGIITHYIYKDCSDYEYINGKVVGVKGGYLCATAKTVVTQDAIEPCLCSAFYRCVESYCRTDFDVDGHTYDPSGHEYDYGYFYLGTAKCDIPNGCEYDYPYARDWGYEWDDDYGDHSWCSLYFDEGKVTVSSNHAAIDQDSSSRSAKLNLYLYMIDPTGKEEPHICAERSCIITQEGETCDCNTISSYFNKTEFEFDESGGQDDVTLGDPCGTRIVRAISSDPDWVNVAVATYDDRVATISVDSLSSDHLERSGEVTLIMNGRGCTGLTEFISIHQKKTCDCSYSDMSVSIDGSASGYVGEELIIGSISNKPSGVTGGCLTYSVDGASDDGDSLTTTVLDGKKVGDTYDVTVTVTLKEGNRVCNTWSGICTITVTEAPCVSCEGLQIGGSIVLEKGDCGVVDTITSGDYCSEITSKSTSDYISASIDSSTGEVIVCLSSDTEATGGSIDFYCGGTHIGAVSVSAKLPDEGGKGD